MLSKPFDRGFVLAVSAPSGAGKTTLCDRLVAEVSGCVRSISATTRPRRNNEVDGKDYQFLDLATFKNLESKGELLETAEVYGHWYGTPKAPVDEALTNKKVIVMDVDTVGAFTIKAKLGLKCVMVFLLPPSTDELKRRLEGRAQNTPEDLKIRLAKVDFEMAEAPRFDYRIRNEDLQKAFMDLVQIVELEASK